MRASASLKNEMVTHPAHPLFTAVTSAHGILAGRCPKTPDHSSATGRRTHCTSTA